MWGFSNVALRRLSRLSLRAIGNPNRFIPSTLPCLTFSRSYGTRVVGTPGTHEYRVFVTSPQSHSSPWHHIPLHSSESSVCVNYVNEIPKGTKDKFEIATKEPYNPIKQDVKKGNLRRFTFGSIPFNYGAIPQTWENSSELDKLTGLKGDNDPLDVVEISPLPLGVGDVCSLKVIGAFILIDEGETDYKIIGINALNPLAPKVNSVSDIHKHIPFDLNLVKSIGSSEESDKIRIEKQRSKPIFGPMNTLTLMDLILHWFQYYKTTDGKGKNSIGLDGRVMDSDEAMEVIRENNKQWKRLIDGDVNNNGLCNDNYH